MSITEARAQAEDVLARINDPVVARRTTPLEYVSAIHALLAALPETPTTDDALIDELHSTAEWLKRTRNYTDADRVMRAVAALRRPSPPTTDNDREALIESATWALIDYDTDVVDRGVSDEHYRERRADVERVFPILTSARRSSPPTEEQVLAAMEAWSSEPVSLPGETSETSARRYMRAALEAAARVGGEA